MRYSLRTLLATFAVVAICCAGLRFANNFTSSLFTTLAFVMVLAGALLAFVQHGERRKYWIGFTVFGAGYFAFATFGERDLEAVTRVLMLSGGPARPAIMAPNLTTTHVLILADSYMQPIRDGAPNTSRTLIALGKEGFIVGYSDESTFAFIAVGQAVFTLVFALIGGWLGIKFARPKPSLATQAALAPSDEIT